MRFDSHAPPRHLTTADFPVYMSLCAAALCADPASPLRKAPLTHKVKSFAAAHSAHYQTGLTCISRAPCLSDFELLPLPSRPSFERRTSGEEEEEEEKEEKEEKDTTVPEEEEVVEEEAGLRAFRVLPVTYNVLAPRGWCAHRGRAHADAGRLTWW